MRRRLVVNAAVAALAASVDIVFLFGVLNPALVSTPAAAVGSLVELAPFYALVLALPGAAAFLLYGWFARRPLPRRWLHWRFWGGFFVLDSLGAALLYGLNGRAYRRLLDAPALDRLVLAGVVVLATAVGVLAAVAIRPLARSRAARAGALALVWGSWGMLAGLSARGTTAAPEARTELEAIAAERPLRVVGIDGLSFDLMLPLVSEGRLPAFARLMKEGSHGSLRSFPPGDEVTLWTTVVTGQMPGRHGVYGPLRYHLAGRREDLVLPPRGVGFALLRATGLVRAGPTAPAHRSARALWDILSSFHVRAAFLGLPLTPEAAELPSVALRRLRPAPNSGPAPPEVEEWFARLVEHGSEPEEAQDDILRQALAADLRVLREEPRLLEQGPPPQVLAVRLDGFDHVAHYFLRYHRPGDFGNVSTAWLERYGQSLAEYMRFLDSQVAREMEAVRGRGVLLVVSPHGMASVSLGRRALRHVLGGPPLSGEHRPGPPGLFLLWGAGVQAGQKMSSARLTDLLPTILYLLGLPVARDLDGEPLTTAFTQAFLEANPASSIPTYEGASIQERGPETFAEPEEEIPPPD